MTQPTTKRLTTVASTVKKLQRTIEETANKAQDVRQRMEDCNSSIDSLINKIKEN